MRFFKSKLEKEAEQVRKELSEIALAREIRSAKESIQTHRDKELYAVADMSVRHRMELQGRIQQEQKKSREIYRQERVAQLKKQINIPPEAVRLLAAAKGQSESFVKVHAEESILQDVSQTPFGFDLIAEYRQLMQVPTLIRELWPYKPTILRTIQMLDFARWILRVIYEECPTAYAVTEGKINFIFGGQGLSCNVVAKPKKEKPDAKPAPQEEAELEAPAEEPEAPEVEADDALVEEIQDYITEFRETNQFHEWEKECYRRKRIEGEAFLWLVPGDPVPTVVCVEPDYIRPSQKKGTNQEDPHQSGIGGQDWSFGILTPKHNYQQPQAYQVVWNDNEEQVIDAKDMFHTAVRERRNIKRCLPPMLKLVDDYIRLTLLRAALAESSKFRASIAGVVKYEQATLGAIKSWEQTVGGNYATEIADGYVRDMGTSSQAANLIDLPPGRDFQQGPNYPDAGSLQQIYDWHLQAIAAAEQVPEWLVKGGSAGSSFADSFTAESPSVKGFETEQAVACEFSKKIYHRVIELKYGEDIFDKIDIQVTSDSVITRDSKSEVEEHILLVNNKLESIATARSRLGLDHEQETRLIEEETAAGLGPQPMLPNGEEGGKDQPETTDGKRQQLEGGEKK